MTSVSVNNLIEVVCAFCRGSGKDPFDLLSRRSLCEVCGGSGRVVVTKPVHRCAFCRGSGVYPGSRLTCTACMGKGVVTMVEPVESCPLCGGTGIIAGHSLPCSMCNGKGCLSSAESVGPRSVRSKTASQRGKT